jgi:poly(ADP-ribose) glycohydrolase ARH3
MFMSDSPSLDQFLGCLLGLAAGDAVGAPYEGLSADNIYWGFGAPDELIKNSSGERLFYTDDTQMMIGVAETLVEHGRIVEAALCDAFVANYHPDRGYGRGARLILEAMATGGPWQEIARTTFPGGSLGNGAAMRVAPVGLLFHDDLDRVMEEARLSALPTHVHPLGIEGACLFAVAVALALRGPPLDRKGLYAELLSRAHSEEFRWHLAVAAGLRRTDTVSVLGSSLEAHRSVITAIACFTQASRSYEDAVARAISLGDDTDTLAAMTGALCGAHLGIASVPVHLIEKLENKTKGRAYIEQLAEKLHARYASRI